MKSENVSHAVLVGVSASSKMSPANTNVGLPGGGRSRLHDGDWTIGRAPEPAEGTGEGT
jgi:hypothetical protein